ncbi:thioredoxin domain-containing protein [Leptospira gomenensis]|uniref:Thioredoxin domain-containing protein n=1 Tax=Leptospira gomenensis TaxID=2484974 RepID=A0A5F1YAU8_9LEPT|nr:thioredoxin domain-containing protein [Leptospira gomenensis]TGK34440.1 thioredoxin domain-containing protein [Leptospira gomenensis]TGK34989.1 thioredoxin domain-containing protein [Leptospira gomenensis]TGK41826.1 thioredoxin domain-containing protein [Leptospira gomenensis]TGK65150.1 thioredoxin domain-containing protein [Leptospira gomenensis]
MQRHSQTPNRLVREKSPYLQQHAYNPVDWFPWGDEAFAKAKSEDKLIFLSIGYATCHWCHVMERESFENQTIASFLNERFVSIKVDREERPDIDRIYMDALHAMDQPGGWPLNLFLTPEGRPITGGTYFPPEPKYGRKSFLEVLNILDRVWKEKKEELLQASAELTRYLKDNGEAKAGESGDSSLPGPESFDSAFLLFESYYDPQFAGFKTNSLNKFPPSMGLSFLLRYFYSSGNPRALEMTERTLIAMKHGGIYDQIGGGLCRYSTDHRWLVPHFEKMLYDNSLFIEVLAECSQVSSRISAREFAMDVIEYLHRDMRTAEGGICSAEDADSEGEEGRFYVWSSEEFREVCGEDSSLLEKVWNVTDAGNFEGRNILHEGFPLSFAEQYEGDFGEVVLVAERARKKLLERRNGRIRPLRDDKILTSWNGLYVKALVKAGTAFQDESLLVSAEETYSFLTEKLVDPNGRILRRYRDGESGILGYSNDYAEMIAASIVLFEAGRGVRFLKNAVLWMEDVIRLFRSPAGVFYDTGTDAEVLLRKSVDGYDGVEPSGNSSIAHSLVRLSALGVDSDRYRAAAETIFAYFSKEISSQGLSFPYMLSAFWSSQNLKREIVIVRKDKNHGRELIAAVQTRFLPDAVVVILDEAELEEAAKLSDLFAGRSAGNSATAYVCENFSCKLPTDSVSELEKQLLQ